MEILSVPGVDVNITGTSRWTALGRAADKGLARIVGRILAFDDVDVNLANRCGDPAILHAVRAGHADVARLLLARPDLKVNSMHENAVRQFARRRLGVEVGDHVFYNDRKEEMAYEWEAAERKQKKQLRVEKKRSQGVEVGRTMEKERRRKSKREREQEKKPFESQKHSDSYEPPSSLALNDSFNYEVGGRVFYNDRKEEAAYEWEAAEREGKKQLRVEKKRSQGVEVGRMREKERRRKSKREREREKKPFESQKHSESYEPPSSLALNDSFDYESMTERLAKMTVGSPALAEAYVGTSAPLVTVDDSE